MFDRPPKILAHSSVLNQGNYVLHEYIINKGSVGINLFKRYCPHRMYPLHDVGDVVHDIVCNFHNFKWDKNGTPVNNDKKLNCGTATFGRSGLIFQNFHEPNHKWVDDIAQEKNLNYSHCMQGRSAGSWLWLMDAEADYLHVGAGHVHPRLSKIIDSKLAMLDQGDGWILQTHKPNWWSLYVYPYTFLEYQPGCLAVNHVVPEDVNSEFNFEWITQYYYDDTVDTDQRKEFETLEDVFKEDVNAIEKQRGKYFPLMNSSSRLEDHCIHFGEWYRKNVRKDND